MHHIIYAVEDGVPEVLLQCEDADFRVIDKTPRKGGENLRIAFLHPKSTYGVLTEFCEL